MAQNNSSLYGSGGRGTKPSTTNWVQNMFNSTGTEWDSVEMNVWNNTLGINNVSNDPQASPLPATTSNGSVASAVVPHTINGPTFDTCGDPALVEALWQPTQPQSGAPGEELPVNFICAGASTDPKNKNFNFLYNLTPIKNMRYNVCSEDYNIYATRVGADNPYYVSRAKGGKSLAIVINNATGLTVPNCVGYAHGRVKEIWALAKQAGFIKLKDGKYVIPNQNNREIKGIVNTEASWTNPIIPCCNAVQFYDNWPNTEGYSKIKAGKVGTVDDMNCKPQVGAIMCWGEGVSGNANPGHVAVVEAVYNYGLENEFVVVSESYYGGSGGHVRSISRNSIYNGVPYSFQRGYTFRGFLVSPICQLSAENEINIELVENHVTIEDKEKYQEITQAILGDHSKITDALNVNDKVVISWFGNEKADGSGKRVGHLDAIGTVAAIDRGKDYPFKVNIGDKLAGYYTRDALEISISENAPTTNTKPSYQDGRVLYKVRLLSELDVRTGPSISFDKIGVLSAGTVVCVYGIKVVGNLTWNNIGTNRWIADDGSDLIVVTTPSEKYKTLVQLHVRSGPGTNYSIIRTLGAGVVITVTEQRLSGNDNYTWNKIGYNQWVADDGTYLQKVQ